MTTFRNRNLENSDKSGDEPQAQKFDKMYKTPIELSRDIKDDYERKLFEYSFCDEYNHSSVSKEEYIHQPKKVYSVYTDLVWDMEKCEYEEWEIFNKEFYDKQNELVNWAEENMPKGCEILESLINYPVSLKKYKHVKKLCASRNFVFHYYFNCIDEDSDEE
mgnify:CR=1 FL=1